MLTNLLYLGTTEQFSMFSLFSDSMLGLIFNKLPNVSFELLQLFIEIKFVGLMKVLVFSGTLFCVFGEITNVGWHGHISEAFFVIVLVGLFNRLSCSLGDFKHSLLLHRGDFSPLFWSEFGTNSLFACCTDGRFSLCGFSGRIGVSLLISTACFSCKNIHKNIIYQRGCALVTNWGICIQLEISMSVAYSHNLMALEMTIYDVTDSNSYFFTGNLR